MSIRTAINSSPILGVNANPLSANSAKKINAALSRLSMSSVVEGNEISCRIISSTQKTFTSMRDACGSSHLSQTQSVEAKDQLANYTVELANTLSQLTDATQKLEQIYAQASALEKEQKTPDEAFIKDVSVAATDFILAITALEKCQQRMIGVKEKFSPIHAKQEESSWNIAITNSILSASQAISSAVQSLPLVGKMAIGINYLMPFAAAAPLDESNEPYKISDNWLFLLPTATTIGAVIFSYRLLKGLPVLKSIEKLIGDDIAGLLCRLISNRLDRELIFSILKKISALKKAQQLISTLPYLINIYIEWRYKMPFYKVIQEFIDSFIDLLPSSLIDTYERYELCKETTTNYPNNRAAQLLLRDEEARLNHEIEALSNKTLTQHAIQQIRRALTNLIETSHYQLPPHYDDEQPPPYLEIQNA